MIAINDAEEILKKEYCTDNFIYLLKEVLLPDYKFDKHPVRLNNSIFMSVEQLGYSTSCDITIFEVILSENAYNRRCTITQEMFKILSNLFISNAIVSFVSPNKQTYRISLLTSKYEITESKIIKIISNPRRYSYSLGKEAKTKTAFQFLIQKGVAKDLEELTSRFSVEAVNKQFYSEIATCFTQLVGGDREGKKFEKQLFINSVTDRNIHTEFAVRLIGRIMFCWFLKEKKSEKDIALIPTYLFDRDKIINNNNYYHDVLEPLFFELLNTQQRSRKNKFATEDIYNQIPYLNGGLFSPYEDDYYKFDNAKQSGQYGIVTIPNEWFIKFYDVLCQYNFTVDENTAYDIELSIDPEMLGRIFENLLAEINPETGENAKKSTGSFYTPRDIVDYMVDNSILEYLKTKTKIDEIDLKSLISYSKESYNLSNFDEKDKKSIVEALYNVKILDPACGSGAFPIGMLQKIVYILQEIDPGANMWFDEIVNGVPIYVRKAFEEKFSSGELNFIRKLTIIEKNIYGIDIQPIAVEIARLRCFLSLVIEQKVNDNEENRGIHPLPSLDFKFIIANSLINLPDDSSCEGEQFSWFEDISHMEELKRIREEYFNAHLDDKPKLREDFANVQKKMFQQTLSMSKNATEKYAALSNWSPFKNEPTSWFDLGLMFGIKEGFDIIIGNPPYIQLQKAISTTSKEKTGDKYEKCHYETYKKTGDIYSLFYEKGIRLLKGNGILTYITSNKWMRAGYGEKLRNYLAKNTNPILLLDFCGQKVFNSATVDVNILILSKRKNKGQTIACSANKNCRDNLSVFVEQNKIVTGFQPNDSWVILSPIEQSIKAKIEKYGVPLKDWDISINYGIKTGFNDAFIIDKAKRDELIALDPKSEEIIRPILRGRDIKRYGYDFANFYLICTFPSLHIDIDKFPVVKKHLLSFGIERLEQTGNTHIINGALVKSRKKSTNKWFETQDTISYWDDFNKQKLMYSEIVQKPQFFLDNGKFYPEATTFILSGENLEYLNCCLNSDICYSIFKKYYAGGGLGEKGIRYKKQFILNLPIPPVFSNEEFIRYLNDRNSFDIEEKIIALFHLTPEQAQILLNSKV